MYAITGSNTSSVAEDELLRILLLLRNYLPGWKQITAGGWDVAAVASKSYDLRDKVVATIGAGRIGYELLKRLKVSVCTEIPATFWILGTQRTVVLAVGASALILLIKFNVACCSLLIVSSYFTGTGSR